MKVVQIIYERGETYRILQNSLGLYFAQKKLGLMNWQYYKDWYGNKIFISQHQAAQHMKIKSLRIF